MRIKLSEKNASTVMQHLNNFFKKSVGELHTTIPPTPLVEMTCSWHPIRKNQFKTIKDKVLLAISTKYLSTIIPMFEGDIVEFKGTRVIIKSQHKLFKGYNKPISFVQQEFTDQEKEVVLKEWLDLEINELYTKNDYFEDLFESNKTILYLSEIKRNLSMLLFSVMMKEDPSQPFDKELLVTEIEDSLKVLLIRDLKEFKKSGLECNLSFRLEVRDKNDKVLYSAKPCINIAKFIDNYFKQNV